MNIFTYTVTDSGHIDVESYLNYIKHLEPMLCNDRPVVIFQDNLFAHDRPELVEFCYSHKIHLFNFPSKSSHLLQPLDKMFGSLKSAIERTRKAMLISPEGVSKNKVPILLRHALKSISASVVQKTFLTTGLCPLDPCAIPDVQLVGDQPNIPTETIASSEPSTHTTTVPFSQVQSPILQLAVFDEDGELPVNNVVESGPQNASTGVQTESIQSLPCSTCIENDVTSSCNGRYC